jgi:hypothetical protein
LDPEKDCEWLSRAGAAGAGWDMIEDGDGESRWRAMGAISGTAREMQMGEEDKGLRLFTASCINSSPDAFIAT